MNVPDADQTASLLRRRMSSLHHHQLLSAKPLLDGPANRDLFLKEAQQAELRVHQIA
jgi:hypothetical protein